ncbi:rotamase PTPA-1 [Thelonectria olida]|uniref:Serine/threonine-protein phosphatase 2A activator n=1 Tax=Thelonectria olida TaxID=1576542 RepID=A0A9P9AKN0_9HYPO|nr:rotamase PTPA-1 [Thelonectria olida]
MASATPLALKVLDLSSTPAFTTPAKRIHEGPDVARFLTSLAYRDIGTFILQLNLALCPRYQDNSPLPRTFPLSSKPPSSPLPASIQALQTLLEKIEGFIGEAPPDPGPRRFGNVSFRKWYAILDERLDELFAEGPLGEIAKLGEGKAKDEISSYLLGGFGSVQRLDYGTGHELSFVAFLGCLWKLGYFQDGTQGGEIERQIVLQVIEPYLRVVRKLILTYTLEPAGSHGVWGLDDHAFMPYIFGSAQLTRPIAADATSMPTEGSVKGAPKPSDIVKPAVVDDYRQTNMYFAAIGFINDVKTGPFWEHSPILFDISGIRDGWGKINKGMIKMFDAEVLSKFPVVQHFPFGALFSWDLDPEAATPTQSVHMVNQPVASAAMAPPPSSTGTAAPWAQAARMPAPTGPGIPYTRVPPPGPSSGTIGTRPAPGNSTGSESTTGQITMTKAPWAT